MRPRHAVQTILAAAVLGIVPILAHAQAVGGAYRGTIPGYYYSAGGYTGGYYFYPGYYPNPASAPVQNTYATGTNRIVGRRVGHSDPSTGRDNIPVPLAKPWLRPLR